MKNIGIIGAGLSGLATAKAFLQAGYRVTVIEKAAAIGGVWEKSRSYLGVATQTTRDEYAYSDYPMPADYPLWPSGEQVQAYLTGYARHFGILPFIRFRTELVSLQYHHGQWYMQVRNLNEGTDDIMSFDFVVICTGTFHKPHIPAFPGLQSFREAGGQVLHSSQVNDEALLKDRSVAVIGFAKSATDIATLAADRSRDCALVYRKAQWKVPRYFGNLVNMRYLLFSRFSEAFFDAPHKTGFQRYLHSAGRVMVWMQWRGLELLLKKQFSLKTCGMVPSHRIEDQISCSLGVAPEGFYEKVKSGRIRAIRSEIAHFEGRKMVLRNGEELTPDLVVCGTGFTQGLPFLEKIHREKIIAPDGSYQLFRNLIHPDVPQLGFVGFNSSLFTTLTSEVAANWMVQYEKGILQLPGRGKMAEDMRYIARWRKQGRPISSEFSGTCVAPFNFMHLDQLMRDMGLRTRATRWLPYEFFKPINPKDYRILLEQIRPGGHKQVHVHPQPGLIR
ncbi:NAD(P)/FAD-dependent oxidoreductase [Chitinophaga sp. XS-30]|uniref:flavin-containing monooxygenase n=1 Tax=Chitinophaga sp. XS-30 TaxID=2604421 RepID=UPI0011DCAA9A|nr:NAD(P)-binding domain-containing protein [Chitinophaga sp. XS-30]QEH43042.1 NAD(P)-binding protein [Chitinophaga sp. XS-30]